MKSLYHHGIKGQKWGVKNGPPYPIKESTRNRELNLTTAIRYQRDNKNYKNRDTYLSYKKDDAKTYEEWLKSYGDENVYEFIYSFKTSLKLPSMHQQKKTFNALCEDELFRKGLSKMYKCSELVDKNPDTDFNDPKIKKILKNTSPDVFIDNKSFKFFNEWFSLRGVDADIDACKNMYIDQLKSQGYNAITDLNDAGSMTEDPLIVFDVEQLISSVSSQKV